MAKMIYQVIRVLDLDRTLDFYGKAFGLELADRYDFGDFTLAYARNAENDFEIELTLNKGRTEPYTLGDGYAALGFSVEDLEAEHARLTGLGFAPTEIRQLAWEGEPMVRFFFVRDPDGYRIDVVERRGRWR